MTTAPYGNLTSVPSFGNIQINEYLTLNGAGVQTNANVNASVTPAVFQIIPAARERYLIRDYNFYIEGNGSISEDGYGQPTTPLTNGVRLQVLNAANAVIMELLGKDAVKKNSEWKALATDTINIPPVSNNYPSFVIRIVPPQPILLDNAKGHKLSFLLNDDFSATGNNPIFHGIFVRGIKLRSSEALTVSDYQSGY